MKRLEELLTKVQKPRLQSESFRLALRNEIVAANHRPETKAAMGFAWGFMTAMAAVVVLLIWKPESPVRINRWISGLPAEREFQQPLLMEEANRTLWENEDLSLNANFEIPKEATTENLHLQFEELKRRFPEQIQEIHPPQTIRIHEYKLPNGRKFQVFIREGAVPSQATSPGQEESVEF